MNDASSNRPWLTKKKMICIAALILVAIYIAAHPTLERWLDTDLPNPFVQNQANQNANDDDQREENNESSDEPTTSHKKNGNASNKNANSDKPNAKTTPGDNPFKLETLARGAFRSPAGLIYQQSRTEHRLDHVMRHSRDIPNRDIHGVFDGDRDVILKLLDEAYLLAKNKSPMVKSRRERNRMVHEVNMNRRVGYVGGKVGKRKKHPACKHVQLVLEKQNVITAYPMIPR